MDLADLFPNSSDRCLKRLKADPLTANQLEALSHLEPVIHSVMAASVPICISLGVMKESNGRTTYSVQITRGKGTMETGHTQRKNRAEYELKRWKHVLLGHDEPNILEYPDEEGFVEVPYS